MGNIGPARQRYDVLPIPDFGIEDADQWLLAPREVPPTMTVPSSPASHAQRHTPGWLRRAARALR